LLQESVTSSLWLSGPEAAAERVERADETREYLFCPICGSPDSETVCSQIELEYQYRALRRFYRRRVRKLRHSLTARYDLNDRLDFTQNYSANIDRCLECGLLFRNPPPPAALIGKAYAGDHYSESHLVNEFLRQRDWSRHKLITLAQWLWQNNVARPRVIEVGSFVGGFLGAAKECGWDVLGVDPGAEVCGFCREMDLPVFQGQLADLEAEPGSIDAVVIWNTFDQLPDPHPTLSAASRLLRRNGLLVIRVPNGECFRSMSPKTRPGRFLGKGIIRTLLAWNNLLAFPYLYGYSCGALNHLMDRYHLSHLQSYPDSLMELAGPNMHRWAAWEETSVKWLCRGIAHLELAARWPKITTAPWIDCYYRLNA